ncbi:glutamyl-tRNA amidotransferase [candidate division BRC1 bacterium SM23_51]|nr:MAG: glutamyl-tRNA amidotransferase [candidate division BRC1 bacterium SM23_51]
MADEKISEGDVRHVAHLSRLQFDDDEVRRLAKDLNNILAYVDKLAELDTENVEPTSHALKMENVLREDEVRPSLTSEQALANAPEREGPFFKVPQIIQES